MNTIQKLIALWETKPNRSVEIDEVVKNRYRFMKGDAMILVVQQKTNRYGKPMPSFYVTSNDGVSTRWYRPRACYPNCTIDALIERIEEL